MYEKEKPKGVPAARGLGYLVAGMVIGVVAVLGVMFMLTLQACACEPKQPPTTLPLIPTPIPGVTGTANSESVKEGVPDVTAVWLTEVSATSFISSFAVDEARNQIAISYGKGYKQALEVRAWSESHVGDLIVVLDGSSGYYEIAFHPSQPTLLASDQNGSRVFPITNERSVKDHRLSRDAVYSPNGQWIGAWTDTELDLVDASTYEIVKSISLDNIAARNIVFSPDSSIIAVAGIDRTRSQRVYVDLYRVSDLERISTYEVTTSFSDSFYNLKLLFAPDQKALIVGIPGAIYKLSLTSSEQQYFSLDAAIPLQISIDSSGRWMGVSTVLGGEYRSLSLFDLASSTHIPPDTPAPIVFPNMDNFQFLKEGLLVSSSYEHHATLTLYRWTGSEWGDPKIVLTEADL